MQPCNEIGKGKGGGDGKWNNVLIGHPTEKWKKKVIRVVEHEGVKVPKKNHLKEEKTHRDSLGK